MDLITCKNGIAGCWVRCKTTCPCDVNNVHVICDEDSAVSDAECTVPERPEGGCGRSHWCAEVQVGRATR
eukprot:4496447-Heterocapsa_arctica.AAC.1